MTAIRKRLLPAIAIAILGLIGGAAAAGAADDVVVFTVSSTVASTDEALTDWDKGTVVGFDRAQDCVGSRCIRIEVTSTTYCDATPGVLGCRETLPDQTCLIQLKPGVLFDGYHEEMRLTVLEHEIGHCIGLGHNQNPRSVMYFEIDPYDRRHATVTAEDRQNVNAVWTPATVRIKK